MWQQSTQFDEIIQPVVEAMGYEYVGCEHQAQSQVGLLRIYIDKSPNGVNIDDCAAVSRQLSAVLDVEDPLTGKYTLEVSSPGVNRPLFTLAHFQQFIGQMVKVKTHHPINEQRNFKGLLQGANETAITIQCEDEEKNLPFADIEKARLIAKFD